MSLKAELQLLISGEVLDDAVTLARASRDASVFEIKPELVVCPKDSEDIKKLVAYARKHPGVSLTVRSGGTDMSGGPLNDSIILDVTRHLNQVKEVGAGRAITEPGVYYRDFEKATLAENLIMPSFPASREICTVGGMVANNAGGEKTLSYGQTKDYVSSLKVILSDGEEYKFKPLSVNELEEKKSHSTLEGKIYREIHQLIIENESLIKQAKPQVSKNSTGYFLWDVWDGQTFDPTKLITGSQGTLGVITEIEFKLVKPKPYSTLLVIFLPDLENLAEIINKILKHQPESFESYDDKTLSLAVKFFPQVAKHFKGGNLFKLGWQFLPELWMMVSGGKPRLILLPEFTGDSPTEAKEKARAAQAALAPFNLKTRLTKNDAEVEKYHLIRRESFSLLRERIKDKQTAPFIDDVIVRPEHLPKFLPELEKILSGYDLIYTIAGHVGDGNFHIIPLMNLADPKARAIIPELADQVYELVFKYEGSMSAEHNDGLIRTPYLKEMYGEQVCRLFEQVKQIFDPQNIFNPHKKVGLDRDYAFSKIKHG